MLGLSLEKLVTCGAIRSYNLLTLCIPLSICLFFGPCICSIYIYITFIGVWVAALFWSSNMRYYNWCVGLFDSHRSQSAVCTALGPRPRTRKHSMPKNLLYLLQLHPHSVSCSPSRHRRWKWLFSRTAVTCTKRMTDKRTQWNESCQVDKKTRVELTYCPSHSVDWFLSEIGPGAGLTDAASAKPRVVKVRSQE